MVADAMEASLCWDWWAKTGCGGRDRTVPRWTWAKAGIGGPHSTPRPSPDAPDPPLKLKTAGQAQAPALKPGVRNASNNLALSEQRAVRREHLSIPHHHCPLTT